MRRFRWPILVPVLALVAAACAAPAATTTTGATTTTTEATTTAATEPEEPFAALTASAGCGEENKNLSEFTKIEAVDRLNVKFTLCFPDPAFPSKVAFTAFAIQSADNLEATGGGGTLIENPVGTGPYRLKEWDRGNQLVLEANSDYWGEPPASQTLVFRWNSEAAARLVELQSGTVDGIDNPGPDDFEVIAGDPNLQLLERQALNVFYIGLNNTKEPFDDERVRQALAMAIDKERIVSNFYPPGSAVAEQFLPPAIPGYAEGVTWYEYDQDAARALLAEADLPDGFEVTLNYRDVVRGYLPQPGVVAQDIQAQLAEIGVTVNIEVMESGAFLDASDAGELTLYLLGWGADYPDATNFLDFHFGTGATAQFGTHHTDIEEVLTEAGSLSDQAARNDLYRTAAELLKEHVPMIPVAHGGSGAAYQADVEGAHVSPLGNEYFGVMKPGDRDTFVWMQNAEPIGLYCADETDGESLRACEQIFEALLSYEVGGVAVQPGLAEEWSANADLTEWTFKLRDGVTFHDGTDLDANDVVVTYSVQWDVENPWHVGRDGNFAYFAGTFAGFLNPPPEEG